MKNKNTQKFTYPAHPGIDKTGCNEQVARMDFLPQEVLHALSPKLQRYVSEGQRKINDVICNLHCEYCFQNEKDVGFDINTLLSMDDYKKLLIHLKQQGFTQIGIVGPGEPFFAKSKDYLLEFGKLAKAEGFQKITIFTTGDPKNISDELLDQIEQEQLPFHFMIKCDSLTPEVQDKAVSNKEYIITGYGKRRNEFIQKLIQRGFNDPEKCQKVTGVATRMGLVGSVHPAVELEDVLYRMKFCVENNLVFDCDFILPVGGGESYEKTNQENMEKQSFALAKEYYRLTGKVWNPNGSYVCSVGFSPIEGGKVPFLDQEISDGEFEKIIENARAKGEIINASCKRNSYQGNPHLYVDKIGDTYPCIGRKNQTPLGNIKETAIEDIMRSGILTICLQGPYTGACMECTKHELQECFGCHGRRNNLSTISDGYIQTNGCPMFESNKIC